MFLSYFIFKHIIFIGFYFDYCIIFCCLIKICQQIQTLDLEIGDEPAYYILDKNHYPILPERHSAIRNTIWWIINGRSQQTMGGRGRGLEFLGKLNKWGIRISRKRRGKHLNGEHKGSKQGITALSLARQVQYSLTIILDCTFPI